MKWTENVEGPRIYPSWVPQFEGEPSQGEFKVLRVDDVRGEGVIARRDFGAGEALAYFSGVALPQITLFTLQIGDGLHLHDPYFVGKLLHSCDPNAQCEMTSLRLVSRRPIRTGETVTIDYETTESRLFRPFDCGCGSETCRGRITGFSGD